MKKRILLLSFCIIFAIFGQAFANNIFNDIKEKPDKRFEFRQPENEIIGKITSIDASKVVIQVATINEIKRGEFIKGNKPEDKKDLEKRVNLNLDDFYTLTGETKTINIASATFDKGPVGRGPLFKDDKKENPQKDKDMDKAHDKKDDHKEKTYADYKVGDYIHIECTDSTHTTAKTIRG